MNDETMPNESLKEVGERYQVLARKHRPTELAGLIGQEAMVKTLSNAFLKGRIAHAFILTGVRGVGKTSTARIIARSLNCIGLDGQGAPTLTPCGNCKNCSSIAKDRHVDVIEMDAASRTGVDDIRDLIEGVGYRPLSARFKVYIIDEVHMLSKSAFNALLKTLEEPPDHVKFVFATTEIRKVPVTVLSRCQRFDLRRVQADVLVDHLHNICDKEGIKATKIALNLITRAADGSVRDALSLLDQAISHTDNEVTETQIEAMLGLADRSVRFKLTEAIFKGDIKASLEIFDQQYSDGADPVTLIEDILNTIHWLTRIKVDPNTIEVPGILEIEKTFGLKLSNELRMAELTRAWQILLKGLNETLVAPSKLQAAEMALIRLTYASELPTPDQALEHFNSTKVENNSAPKLNVSQLNNAEPEKKNLKSKKLKIPIMPKNFEDIIDLIEKHREGKLAYFLTHCVRLIHCSPGKLIFQSNVQEEKSLLSDLKDFLLDQTGIKWTITLKPEEGMPTIAEKRTETAQQQKVESLSDPIVQAVIKTFPKAKIARVRKLNSN